MNTGPIDTSPPCRGGVLFGPDAHPFPLRLSRLAMDARAGLARVVFEQRFVSPYDGPVSAVYAFGLPQHASVAGFSFRWVGRRIVGEIARRSPRPDPAAQPREIDMNESLVALSDGERDGRFLAPVGLIPAGVEVIAELVIDQRLEWVAETGWRWSFPFAADPTELSTTWREGARCAWQLAVRDELTTPPHSVSHSCNAVLTPDGRWDVTPKDEGATIIDRDLELEWRAGQPAIDLSFDLARHADKEFGAEGYGSGAHALLALLPPVKTRSGRSAMPVHARDVVILLDTSAGGSIKREWRDGVSQLVAAIAQSLGERDTLEITSAASDTQKWHPEPVLAHPDITQSAVAWAASARGTGANEIVRAVEEALRPVRPDAQRQVIFVTEGVFGGQVALETEIVRMLYRRPPPGVRLFTVGIGGQLHRSFLAASARAGRGMDVAFRGGPEAELKIRSLLSAMWAPVLVDVTVEGPALIASAPIRGRDVYLESPSMLGLSVRPEGGELMVRGRAANGLWEHLYVIPPTPRYPGSPAVVALFGRERSRDLDMELTAGGPRSELEASIERIGYDYQVATRITSWAAVMEEATLDPRDPLPRRRTSQAAPPMSLSLARPMRVTGGLALPPLPGTEFDDDGDGGKTRITTVGKRPQIGSGGDTARGGCLVCIYTKDPTSLGKRLVLQSPTRIGRGNENEIVLEGDSVSRRHAIIELRGDAWYCADAGSTNGTYVNDTRVSGERKLTNGDRVKVGPTIFKYFTGDDVEALYHEEIYRMTIIDGLTGAHLKRYLLEHLEKEIGRAKRHRRPLTLLMFDLDHFKQINDQHGHLAGDHVLKEVARLVLGRIREGEVLARYGGEEFALVLPETPLEAASTVAEAIRRTIESNVFEFGGERIPVTISCGVAILDEADRTGAELIGRADEKLYTAKRGGRNRVAW
jgi:two-component system cell cycle response regulator